MNFSEYEEAAVSTAIYPGRGYPIGLMYVALKMNGEAGEFAEHIGKSIRDDDFAITSLALSDVKRELLIKEIGDVLWYLAAGARELGTDLETIAKTNIEKLAKRKAEGKLGGSGDNR